MEILEEKILSIKKNIIWNSVGTFINMFCQWLMTILIVHLSGFGDAGNLSLAMSIGSVMQVIAVFGVKNYQVSDIKSKYTDSTYVSTRFLTCIITTLLCFLWVLSSAYDFKQSSAIILYTLYLMIFSFVDVYYGIQQKKWRMDMVGISMTIRSIAALFIFCILIYFTKNINVAIFGMFIVSLIVAISFDRRRTRQLSHYSFDINIKESKKLLSQCLPIVLSGVMITLAITIPRLFFERYFGREELGIYSSIAAPVMIIQVAAGFVFNPLITKFAELYTQRKKKEIINLFVKCIFLILVLLIVGLAGAYFLGDYVLLILFKKRILDYSYILLPLVVVSVLVALSTLVGTISTVIRDFSGLLYAGVIGVITSLVLSFMLIKEFYMNGINLVLFIALIAHIFVLAISNIIKIRKGIPANE